jgi:large subunit ribosomal protein L28
MGRRCDFSKVGGQAGNRVSHANNKTKHVFKANLQARRLFIPALQKFVSVRISTRVLRTIDKIGLDAALRKYNLSVQDICPQS